MFQFPAFASTSYEFTCGYLLKRWVAPFGHPRVNVELATRRGLSQLVASFFAFYCLGIHRRPLYALVNERLSRH
jgi:hypothetical protein